jgi:hypothetical protein
VVKKGKETPSETLSHRDRRSKTGLSYAFTARPLLWVVRCE